MSWIFKLLLQKAVETDLCSRDVRQVIKAARKEMLQGCKVVFSRVFPNTSRPQEQMMWKMAETRGRGSGNREGPLGCEQQEVFGPPALDQSRQFPMAPATGGRFSRNSPEGKEQR